MRNNRTPLGILSVLLIGLLFISSIAEAQSVQELREAREKARKFVKEEEAEHKEANDHLNDQIANFVRMHGHLANIELPRDSPATSTPALIIKFTKIVDVIIKTKILTDPMKEQLAAIETQREKCNNLWADVLLAQTAYEDAVDAYNAKVSPEEQQKTVEVPQAPPAAPLYLCPGPCSTPFTTKVLATTSHQVFCQDELHKASGYSYYSCPPDNPGCPLPSQHTENLDMLACRGPCGKPVPNLSGIPDDSSHRQGCMEKSWFREPIRIRGQDYIRMYVKDCPQGEYYHCKIGLLCPNSDNHVGSSESREDKYVDPQGNVVDSTTVTRDCGHSLSASGDHTQQASCSVTNNRGQSCTVTNFYACQSHTHTYPNARFLPLQTVRQRCRNTSCSKGGYTTLYDTHRSRCRLWHSYWDCDPAAVEKHKVRTCARCSNSYQNCDGGRNPCISGLGHTETVETSAEAPSTPQPNPSPPSETPPTTSPEESDTTENEEQETEEEDMTEVPEETTPARSTAVCGSGHTYATDRTFEVNRHKDQTCLRCSQTYQNCSNHATACQNRRWHTQDDTAYMRGECGHSHRINEKSRHALVTCTTTNANGDRCNGGSYYACQSHTHTYSAPTETPTPSPSPPENSNPNPNENEEEEEEEEEVPVAPPAPPPSYHPCGQHLTTVSGIHTKQASCSTDSTCIATNFYQCQHSSHTYPAAPAPRPTAVCSEGHSYYTDNWELNRHRDRTCTRCSLTYQNCTNSSSACQGSRWHTETPQTPPPPTTVPCARAECGETVSDRLAHKVADCPNCDNHYWTCIDGATAQHTTTYTCRRDGCGQTFTRCGNTPTACVRPGKPSNYHWASD